MTVYSRGLRHALASEETLETPGTLQVLSLVHSHSRVKFAAAFITLFGSAAAVFGPCFLVWHYPWWPFPWATLKRYHEDELTHGHVLAMLVVSSWSVWKFMFLLEWRPPVSHSAKNDPSFVDADPWLSCWEEVWDLLSFFLMLMSLVDLLSPTIPKAKNVTFWG